MTYWDEVVLLRDMVDAAREAVAMLGERQPEDLAQDLTLSLALAKLIEIVLMLGQAVSAQ